MSAGIMLPQPDVVHTTYKQRRLRATALLVLGIAIVVALSFDDVHAGMQRMLAAAEPVITKHPIVGTLLFVLLSAISAVIAFFSSVLLVPAAVYTWGTSITIALLWLGWWLGGLCTYALGRALRRPLVRVAATVEQFDFYRQRVSVKAGFTMILLLQLALPSEIPGYLCGVLRVPPRIYLAALAVGELPYAVGTVLIGDSLLERRPGGLLLLGILGAALSGYAMHRLRRQLDGQQRDSNI